MKIQETALTQLSAFQAKPPKEQAITFFALSVISAVALHARVTLPQKVLITKQHFDPTFMRAAQKFLDDKRIKIDLGETRYTYPLNSNTDAITRYRPFTYFGKQLFCGERYVLAVITIFYTSFSKNTMINQLLPFIKFLKTYQEKN